MQARVVAFPASGGLEARSLSSERLEARGKFFFAGSEKVRLNGVTYGPFAPDGRGDQFPDPKKVETDLGLMVELGANTHADLSRYILTVRGWPGVIDSSAAEATITGSP